MSQYHCLFVVAFVAVIAPLLTRFPASIRTPAVILELIFGILIGPSGAGWVTSHGVIGQLGEFGLIFLFFQAGFEFNPAKIGAGAHRLGALAWLVSLGLSGVSIGLLYLVGSIGLLYLVGLVRAPLLVGIVLPTTAFGMLIPILRQSGEFDSNFGRYVLGAAAIGEIGPLILVPLALAGAHEHLHQTLSSMAFLATAVGAIVFARSLRSERLSRMIARWMGDSSVLPVRISILILFGIVSLANEFGMELVLGAYTAGAMIAMLTKVEILQYRLTAIGSGFFIPLFFIMSGVEFDLPALVTSPASLARLILFFAGFLFIRVIPVVLYKRVLPERDLLPLALYSATTLPLVVAVTYLGVRSGDMLPENASALVGAAVLTVAVFPTLAIVLRSKLDERQPEGTLAIATHRLAGLASAQFSRYLDFVTWKTWGKP